MRSSRGLNSLNTTCFSTSIRVINSSISSFFRFEICQKFSPTSFLKSSIYQFSQKFDFNISQSFLSRLIKTRVYGIYKKKTEKIQPVNSSNSDGSTLDGNKNWKKRAIQQERFTVEVGAKYKDLLIPKFSDLAKRSRLTPERLQKMIVDEAMILQEK